MNVSSSSASATSATATTTQTAQHEQQHKKQQQRNEIIKPEEQTSSSSSTVMIAALDADNNGTTTTVPITYGQTSTTLWGPRLVTLAINNNNNNNNHSSVFELSIHTLPKPLVREFRHVFPEHTIKSFFENTTTATNANANNNCDGYEYLAIPTNQNALLDLVGIGEQVEHEKDRLLNVFLQTASILCTKLRTEYGYWADYIDPCSGLPMLSLHCTKVYSEVDGMECCLQYKSYNAGYCKILIHPIWGSAVYPATIFAYGPRQQIIQIITSQLQIIK